MQSTVSHHGKAHHGRVMLPRAQQQWADFTFLTSVQGLKILDSCAKILPAVGMLEKRPLSAGSGSLPRALGTWWHPVSGILVQSWEKHRLCRCFPAALLFSEPVSLQGHLRVGRVEPAPHLHFPEWGLSVRGLEGLDGGSVGLQPSRELSGHHEAALAGLPCSL